MALKPFKAESKRLMDLMIHSIYTHKEIFLRELISNASDALDKLYHKSLTEELADVDRTALCIRLAADKEGRTLTVSDNGIGMTKEELDANLGVIAKSGSKAFKEENETSDEVDIIGQFGVGFYSAFMVADRVTVVSRACGSEESWKWESSGVDGYRITPAEKAHCGTEITLHLLPDGEEENYSEFLDPYRLRGLVKKYSDYIRYPIRMEMEKSRPKEGSEGEFETYTEEETLNSMVPIWKKSRSEVSDEEYGAFYKEKFGDWQDPARVIRTSTEGAATYNALLFIPSHPPMDYYTKAYEKGLQLYASGVLIMDKCADLLPDHFSFVKGLVDSQDLSLNISREMLQHDRQLQLIAARLEKKIAAELKSMLENDREKYAEFFKNFGLQLKYGVYDNYGLHKDELKDLLLFASSGEEAPVTLAEYVSRMKEGQTDIYYACGESAERLARLPQAEAVLEKGYEILYLTDNVDEFALKTLHEYEGKHFKNISADDLDLSSEEEKKQAEQQAEEYKPLLEALSSALSGKVEKVILSHRLKNHPVCLSSEGEITLEMEKVLNAMPQGGGIKAKRVLELNPAHPVFARLEALRESDPQKLADYAGLLYDQALLIEGLPIEDPADFSNRICALM